MSREGTNKSGELRSPVTKIFLFFVHWVLKDLWRSKCCSQPFNQRPCSARFKTDFPILGPIYAQFQWNQKVVTEFTWNALGREASGCQYLSQMLSPEETHTLKTGNKTPGLTTPGQFLGYSLQPRTAIWYFQYFTLHSSGCISDLKFADCSETSGPINLPTCTEIYPWLDIPKTCFKTSLVPVLFQMFYLLCKFEKTKAWLKGILLNNSCRCWVFSSKVLCGRGWEFTIL